MLKARVKSFIILFFIVALCTCIDPYISKFDGSVSLLVVEGLITNENVPYEVDLSRSKQDAGMIAEKVSDAVVSVIDETGKQTGFKNLGSGVYKTDNNIFTGAIGQTYILDIVTSDGKEYKSDPSGMTPVPDIDSIYYEKDVKFTNNQSETHTGISLYLDSKAGDENNKYYRWDIEETWKFRVPNPQKFIYLNDSVILPSTSVKEYCWKEQRSSEILLDAVLPGESNIIRKKPLCFITPDKTDRLTIQYSILVKQYSLSAKEYEFWSDVKKVSENSGDIFGSQPFPVMSNIHNINDPGERVLGYFQVSAVKQKRKFITFMELRNLNLSFYNDECKRIETCPSDYCQNVGSGCVPPTWDELYLMWINAKYIFSEPYYDPLTGKLSKFIFTSEVCGNCELTGTINKPEFWIDLN